MWAMQDSNLRPRRMNSQLRREIAWIVRKSLKNRQSVHLVRVAATVGGRTTHSKLTDRLHVWSRHWDLDGFGTTVFSEGSSGRLAG